MEMNKHYVSATGEYLGQFLDGAVPPEGAIPVEGPPPKTLSYTRAATAIPRAAFCNAMADAGTITDQEAIDAAKGAWPASLDGFLTYLDPKQARDAQIEWASCATVERLHSFVMSLAWWMELTDAEVDALFGIAAPVAARKTREK